MLEKNKIYQGDALEVLKTFPEKSINCCVTSPPYWALRDYGVDGQLGLEPNFNDYINKLCDIFDGVKRVLRDDGTLWVNMGDTYYTKSGSGFDNDNISKDNKGKGINKANEIRGGSLLQSKSLSNIPARFSIEMQNRGWILRNVVIWHKPNCMPSSVKDRFTVDFEYVYFFTKKKKYWFKQQFEPHKEFKKAGLGGKGITSKGKHSGLTKMTSYNPKGRNKRTVWKISTKPYREAHFATYPKDLIEPMIKAGCPEKGIVLDPFIGSGTTGVVALEQNKDFVGIELNKEYIKLANKRLKPLIEQTKIFEYGKKD